MRPLEAMTLLGQLLLPLLLIGWVAVAHGRGRAALALDVAIAGVYLLAIALAAPWLALPRQLLWVLAVLLAVAALVRFAGVRGAPPRERLGRRKVGRRKVGGWKVGLRRVGLAARAVLLVGLVWVVGIALVARRELPGEAVELAFPLRGGSYLVAGGGSRQLLNPHLRTLRGERYRDYRGQSYAVDLVGVGRWGSRRTGLSPQLPEGFAIFGDTVVAPCGGRVVAAMDGQPDRLPPDAEPRTLEGNHVVLQCGRVWVVLAHLRQGSLAVAEGEPVETGERVGLVGNSGQSDEPHLHIHAQLPGSVGAPLSGEPVPMRIRGRQLVRGDRIDAR